MPQAPLSGQSTAAQMLFYMEYTRIFGKVCATAGLPDLCRLPPILGMTFSWFFRKTAKRCTTNSPPRRIKSKSEKTGEFIFSVFSPCYLTLTAPAPIANAKTRTAVKVRAERSCA
jgi:hypothetical protein